MISVNQEEKIQFTKDGLSKESLVDIIQALDTHPSDDVCIVLFNLMKLFNKKKKHYSLGDLILKDPICQFIRKLFLTFFTFLFNSSRILSPVFFFISSFLTFFLYFCFLHALLHLLVISKKVQTYPTRHDLRDLLLIFSYYK